MKRGLTVLMPIPALFTNMSMLPSRDDASSTAPATDHSSRTSSSMPIASPGSSAATELARWPDRPVSATVVPAAARAEAMASPSPLVPPVSSALIGGVRSQARSATPCPAWPSAALGHPQATNARGFRN